MADDPIRVSAKSVAELGRETLVATSNAEAAINARDLDGLVTATRGLLDAIETLLMEYGRAMATVAVDRVESPALVHTVQTPVHTSPPETAI